MKRVRIALAFLVTLLGVSTAAAQRLVWLGTLGGNKSQGHGVSPDGRFVVGVARDASGADRAVRWDLRAWYTTYNTELIAIEELGTLGGTFSEAYGVSADGSVVVGSAATADNLIHAFRWEATTGEMKDLGTLGGTASVATAISADGRFVVGWAEDGEGRRRPFRWDATTGVMQDLGTLGGPGGWANDVAADGRSVVGMATNTGDKRHAFRWDASTETMQDLGTLDGTQSEATGISENGDLVVGFVDQTIFGFPPTTIRRAFLWDIYTEQMVRLDTLESYPRDYWYEAHDVSANGFFVVGVVRDQIGTFSRAVRWQAWRRGIEDLNDAYASLLTDGSILYIASAISPDGRYIVGSGYNAATGRVEAYLLDTGIATATDASSQPEAFRILPPWPNPFREAVHVPFHLPAPTPVRLEVYDLLGRSVRVLVEGPLGAGTHTFVWDGRDGRGRRLPPGLYVLRLEAGGRTATRIIACAR
ncbi:FlgD immunoglobulin-like domain containing protein [Rhodothermus marinus]|uniref:FlgD immunoglobulin-like domain containing protein n=1 Tax=Rhodothermus marinus TaxID=29549 RepID=UPI0037CBEC16